MRDFGSLFSELHFFGWIEFHSRNSMVEAASKGPLVIPQRTGFASWIDVKEKDCDVAQHQVDLRNLCDISSSIHSVDCR